MPDYNIYLHADFNGSSNKTKPFSVSKNSPTKTRDEDQTASTIMQGINNPDSLVSAGVHSAAKAIPYVAVAMAVIKFVDKGINTLLVYDSINTGDFSRINQYNNFKANFRFMMSPFSSQMNYLQTATQRAVQDINTKNNQLLLGDSVINTRVTGRTV